MTAPRQGIRLASRAGFWRLFEMLTVLARPYILLGEEIQSLRGMFLLVEADKTPLSDEEKAGLVTHLNKLLEHCEHLNMPISKHLITARLQDPPNTGREFDLLIDALYAELKDKLFVFVPEHLRKYFQPRHFMSEETKATFPTGRKEMADAGRSHAVGLHTAAVFHCVRAIEIGLRAMGTELKVEFPFPIEQADWEPIINQMESKIRALKEQPKSEQKDADLKFFSEAAMQFRYFKDAWRIRVAHARGSYQEPEAQAVLEHAASFLGILAKRVKEPAS